jgi:hypothetical protein
MQASADGCWLPHQELNPLNDHPVRWMVVRSNPEPVGVNLRDNQYGETADEYAKRLPERRRQRIGDGCGDSTPTLRSICLWFGRHEWGQ